MKKTIRQLEALIEELRIHYIKQYAKEKGWDISKLCREDLTAIYVCVGMQQGYKFNKKSVDKK